LRFEFATSNRILFGQGTASEVPDIAISLGRNPFLVTTSQERSTSLLERLAEKGLSTTIYIINGEPDISSVNVATRKAKEANSDLVIAFGGGSTLDTGKAVAALLTNPGDVLDYIEVIGKGLVFKIPSVPCIAIPTTAGTGSEVTRNAVIFAPEPHLKASLRSPHLLPRISVVDPELTYSVPPNVTAFTGMDTLTQLIEPFVSNTSTPLTDIICRDGISRVSIALEKVYHNGLDTNARENMSLASLYSGMALANARLGAVHGLAAPLGGIISAPHGAICARLLPIVMDFNLKSLQKYKSTSAIIDRYLEISRLLTGNKSALISDGAIFAQRLCDAMKIQSLSEFGLKKSYFPEVIMYARNASSMKGNPVVLSDAELFDILERAI
jgi:alcohol dehydrogenase class IV